MRNIVHFPFRPKPPVKLPSSLVPSSAPTIKKPSVSQNGHHGKQATHGNEHFHHRQSPISISQKCTWSLGLINFKGKYLTAETFGCKINASEFVFVPSIGIIRHENFSSAGSCLKKKQKWTIIYNNSNDCVYLQSSLEHYLSTDKYGRLKCDALDVDANCRFQLEYNRTGQWAFKSLTYGMYLGGDADQLHCFSKTPEWWLPHLALHPQVQTIEFVSCLTLKDFRSI